MLSVLMMEGQSLLSSNSILTPFMLMVKVDEGGRTIESFKKIRWDLDAKVS